MRALGDNILTTSIVQLVDIKSPSRMPQGFFKTNIESSWQNLKLPRLILLSRLDLPRLSKVHSNYRLICVTSVLKTDVMPV